MLNFLAIALGATIGANVRYWISNWAVQRLGPAFPYGTLIVNVLGCFVIGLLLVLATTRLPLSGPWRLALITGLLGSLTTFSTFSYETYQLLVTGNWLFASLNLFGSVALGLLAVMLGAGLARLFS